MIVMPLEWVLGHDTLVSTTFIAKKLYTATSNPQTPNQLQATSEDRRLRSDRILAETIDLCNSLVGNIVFMSPD